MAEVSHNFFKEQGFKSEEVDAILKAAEDDNTWKLIEGLESSENKDVLGGILPPPTPVDPKDPHVIEVGKFAVMKHNEQAGTKLEFVRVICGVKWSLIGGNFFALFIATKDSKGAPHRSQALVFEIVAGSKRLIRWKDIY